MTCGALVEIVSNRDPGPGIRIGQEADSEGAKKRESVRAYFGQPQSLADGANASVRPLTSNTASTGSAL